MKKMSFIRWGGFIPFIVIALLSYIFAVYYMDSLLKRALSKNATRLNGALVEMDSLRLSFLSSSLKIKRLEAANPSNLMQNRFEIGEITLDFAFLPLLKKRFVTEEISVTQVRWLTPRKTEGKIPESWKREWEKDAKTGESEISKFVSEAVANLTESIKSELPDISLDSLKQRFDPRKAIKLDELESYRKAFEVKDNALNSYKSWNDKTDRIVNDQKKFISDIRKKIDELNPKNLNTPQSIVSAINTVTSFEKDIKAQRNLVTGKLNEIKDELKGYKNTIESVPDLLKADINAVVSKYSLGSFKIDRFSEQIFGMDWIPGFQKYVMYRNRFTSYYSKLNIGTKDKEKEKKPIRYKGMDIAFPITDNTPAFLVKKVHLSAQTREKEKSSALYEGKYDLKINDVSSNQKLYGKPTTAFFNFDTYDGLFSNANVDLLVDYRDEPNRDKLKLEVRDFKLSGFTLGKGSIFPLPLKGGSATASLAGGTTGENVMFDIAINVKNASYGFEKSSNYLVEILQNIIRNIKAFRVDIGFFGTLKDPKFKISSNLDRAIADGVKKVFEDKINEVRTKAEKYIRDEVTKNLDTAKAKVQQLQTEAQSRLSDELKRVDLLSKDAQKKLEELKAKQKSAASDKIKGLFK